MLLSDWLDNDWSLLPSEVVGLLLGYPIEATLSSMVGNVNSGTDSESGENEDEDSEGEEKSGEEC